jgi:pimeloyl-ACP methyl ester carboxylesterase
MTCRDILVSVSLLLAIVNCAAQEKTENNVSISKQPRQPLHGPGSKEVVSRTVVPVKIADGALGGWLFLPADPRPEKAPVIVFCHGWSAIFPRGYQAWINHLVMRGNIVLWPNYQENLRTPTRQFLPNAIAAVKSGIQMLQTEKYAILPDLDRVAVVGHSAGGMTAAGIAAKASAESLPKIKALMVVEPGDSQRGGIASVPLADLSTISTNTLLLILVGEEDASVGTYDGERILHESIGVPASNKRLLMLRSDDHGSPALVANHFTPSAMLKEDGSFMTAPFRPAIGRNTIDIGVVDALDYYGTWRLLDQLLEEAFADPIRNQMFEDPSLLMMGKWSDGTSVKPMTRLK